MIHTAEKSLFEAHDKIPNLTVNCMWIGEMAAMALDLAALQQSSGSHGLSNFLKLAC